MNIYEISADPPLHSPESAAPEASYFVEQVILTRSSRPNAWPMDV
jgi:hypothetical protein